MQSWKTVWREGFAPVLPTRGLEALRDALRADDCRLLQRATVMPPLLTATFAEPCEAACPVGWCGWFGENLETVGQVDEFWNRALFEADQRLGEPAACRWFLNWVDAVPRDVLVRELLPEVERVLAERVAPAAA